MAQWGSEVIRLERNLQGKTKEVREKAGTGSSARRQESLGQRKARAPGTAQTTRPTQRGRCGEFDRKKKTSKDSHNYQSKSEVQPKAEAIRSQCLGQGKAMPLYGERAVGRGQVPVSHTPPPTMPCSLTDQSPLLQISTTNPCG